VPAADVRRDHEAEWITDRHDFAVVLNLTVDLQLPAPVGVTTLVMDEMERDARGLHRIEPVAAIEQGISIAADDAGLRIDHDSAGEPVLADVLAELAQLVGHHRREQLGRGVDRDDVAPGLAGGGHDAALARPSSHSLPCLPRMPMRVFERRVIGGPSPARQIRRNVSTLTPRTSRQNGGIG